MKLSECSIGRVAFHLAYDPKNIENCVVHIRGFARIEGRVLIKVTRPGYLAEVIEYVPPEDLSLEDV